MMIVFRLLKQQWQKNMRAKGFYKNLTVNIVMGISFLYLLVLTLFSAFMISSALNKADSGVLPTEIFNSIILYAMIVCLLIRYFMQKLNVLNLQTYQILPIKRLTLVNFLLLKPLFSPLSYLTMLFVIPFAIKSVGLYHDTATTVRFVLNIILLIWFNSLIVAFLKRKFGASWWAFLVFLVPIGILIALEYFKIFSLMEVSRNVFGFILQHSFMTVVLAILPVSAYVLNRWFFSQNFYPETFNQKLKTDTIQGENQLSFLNRFGIIGEFIALELKLILRHKRTKSLLYVSGLFLLYGLLFYTRDIYADSVAMLFFCALFMTGILMFMFGQWVISWDSCHFDGLMTKNIPIKSYIAANYYLMIAFNAIFFVLTTPYFFFGEKIILMHIAAFLFNLGVNVPLLIFFATYNTKRIDLSNTSPMNFQGTTFKNFLVVLPIMFLPMLLIGVLSIFAGKNIALIVIALLGLLGLILHKQLIAICVKQFHKRKYALASGFREKE